METEKDTCFFCGGIVVPKVVTWHQVIHGEPLVITDVPTSVCSQCGERYISADVSYSMEQILNQGTPAEYLQVPVYRFAPVERPERPPAAKARQNSA